MSGLPSDENKLVVHRTDLEPSDRRDSRSTWEKFIDALRTTVGLKPLYLAERWATAKVLQEEVDASVRLLKAKAEYQRTMAEAKKLELEAEAASAKGMAEAERIRLETRILSKANPLVERLFKARSMDPDTAQDNLNSIIQRIEMLGGVVELELPELPEASAAPDDSAESPEAYGPQAPLPEPPERPEDPEDPETKGPFA